MGLHDGSARRPFRLGGADRLRHLEPRPVQGAVVLHVLVALHARFRGSPQIVPLLLHQRQRVGRRRGRAIAGREIVGDLLFRRTGHHIRAGLAAGRVRRLEAVFLDRALHATRDVLLGERLVFVRLALLAEGGFEILALLQHLIAVRAVVRTGCGREIAEPRLLQVLVGAIRPRGVDDLDHGRVLPRAAEDRDRRILVQPHATVRERRAVDRRVFVQCDEAIRLELRPIVDAAVIVDAVLDRHARTGGDRCAVRARDARTHALASRHGLALVVAAMALSGRAGIGLRIAVAPGHRRGLALVLVDDDGFDPFVLGLGSALLGRGVPLRLPPERRAAALLERMGELMGEQRASGLRMRREGAAAEHDVVADGVGARVDGARRLRRAGVRVHAHAREVVAEARLHEGACRRVQRTAARRHDVVDDVRRLRRPGAGLLAMDLPVFLLAGRAGALQHRPRCRHAHHALGDAVGLALRRIVRGTDREFAPERHAVHRERCEIESRARRDTGLAARRLRNRSRRSDTRCRGGDSRGDARASHERFP